jgi:hypothetical protein
MKPLTACFSATQGFVVYRASKPILQITDRDEAQFAAARLLMFPQMVDGEKISDTGRRVYWAQLLLKVVAATSE